MCDQTFTLSHDQIKHLLKVLGASAVRDNGLAKYFAKNHAPTQAIRAQDSAEQTARIIKSIKGVSE